MTILEKPPPSGNPHAARGWHGFGRRDQVVHYTEAWEHETFAEEQARWERGDPDYARICEQVRLAKERGGEASLCAIEAKAEWDARLGAQRQANDDAQKADHALKADQTARRSRAASRNSSQRRNRRWRTTFAMESYDSPAPGIMPEPVRVHDEPAVTSAARSEQPTARFRFRSRATRNSVGNEPTKLAVG
jgi:hypothetical protein